MSTAKKSIRKRRERSNNLGTSLLFPHLTMNVVRDVQHVQSHVFCGGDDGSTTTEQQKEAGPSLIMLNLLLYDSLSLFSPSLGTSLRRRRRVPSAEASLGLCERKKEKKTIPVRKHLCECVCICVPFVSQSIDKRRVSRIAATSSATLAQTFIQTHIAARIGSQQVRTQIILFDI